MPFPVAAAITAGATLAGTGATAYSQGKLNRKTRLWNEKMHNLVRQESLADWAMQNEYNSPKAQMQRYRDAGLNPNLIYGQSNVSEAVRSTPQPSWNPHAPSYEGIGRAAQTGLSTYYDVQLKEASLDNLTARNTVLLQEAALKQAATVNTLSRTAKTDFELALATQLRETSLEAANENLRKLRIQNQYTLNEDERKTLQLSQSLQEGLVRILGMKLQQAKQPYEIDVLKAQIDNLKQDSQLKQLDKELKQNGMDKSPWWFQLATRILSDIGMNPAKTVSDILTGKKSLKIPDGMKPINFPGLEQWYEDSKKRKR